MPPSDLPPGGDRDIRHDVVEVAGELVPPQAVANAHGRGLRHEHLEHEVPNTAAAGAAVRRSDQGPNRRRLKRAQPSQWMPAKSSRSCFRTLMAAE